MLVRFVLVLTHYGMRALYIGRSDVEERTDSLADEDNAAAVRVWSDVVLEPRVREHFLERESLFEALGDVDECQLLCVFYCHDFRVRHGWMGLMGRRLTTGGRMPSCPTKEVDISGCSRA
jgi:hypothetical protein